jgi:hypothetical protein
MTYFETFVFQKSVSQEAMQCRWGEWKSIIHDVLDEVNQDAFHGRGRIRENSYKERSYLLLETKQECLYVFPIPGNTLIISVYQHKISKENLKAPFGKPDDEENIIGTFGLGIGGVDAESSKVKKVFKSYFKKALKTIYRNYWLKPSW